MAKEKERMLLVDGNNLLLRAYFKFKGKGFTNGKVQTGGIYGFFKILHANIVRFRINKVVICFDHRKSKHRLDIYPEYKAHRQKISEDWTNIFSVQFPIIRRILRNLGITYIWDNNCINEAESDDYLALLYQRNCVSNDIFLLSSDEDFVQLLNYPNIKIINPSKDALITTKNCKEVYGYEYNQAVDMKVLIGDTSDNITGVKGVGPKTALKILEKQTAKQYLDKVDPALYKRNLLLIDLFYYLTKHPITELPIHGKKHKKDMVTLNVLFEKYHFKSFMASEFIKPFKQLKSTTV